MMRQVVNAIEELPANIRTILKEYYLQGKKYKDIANEHATTPDAVRMQKNRGIKLLQQRLLLFFIIIIIICAHHTTLSFL